MSKKLLSVLMAVIMMLCVILVLSIIYFRSAEKILIACVI